MGRTLAAWLPALAVSVAWLRVEDPRTTGTALAVALLALAPALARRVWLRALAAVAATAGAVWVAFRAEAWELVPFRDERVLGPVFDSVRRGVEDFYGVLLPFEPQRNRDARPRARRGSGSSSPSPCSSLPGARSQPRR
jgi:hypothetical protein